MSPEWERLLQALYERRTCEPGERARWQAEVDRLVANALDARPGLSREALWSALESRYKEVRRARRKPPSVPPIA